MSNTTISVIMWVILVVLQWGYRLSVFKLGEQSGRERTVIKFLKDNRVLREEE